MFILFFRLLFLIIENNFDFFNFKQLIKWKAVQIVILIFKYLNLIIGSEKQYIHALKRKEKKISSSSEDDLLEVSIFDETVGLFDHMQKDLLQALCDRVMMDIKAKSRPYRKEK